MKQFKLSQLTEELKQEIAACDTAEALKALFAAKDIFVPDSKLESILKLKERLNDLDMDALEGISGGGCRPQCFMVCPKHDECQKVVWCT